MSDLVSNQNVGFLTTRLKYCCVHPIGSNSREIFIHPNDAGRMANSEDPDPKEQSDLGLHCVSRPVCRKTVISVGCDDPIIYEYKAFTVDRLMAVFDLISVSFFYKFICFGFLLELPKHGDSNSYSQHLL